MMRLDANNYKAFFEGYVVVDCVVRTKKILYFILKQLWDEETDSPPKSILATRIVGYFNEPSDPGWVHVELTASTT